MRRRCSKQERSSATWSISNACWKEWCRGKVQAVECLPLLREQERRQLLEKWTRGVERVEKVETEEESGCGWFERQVELGPNRVAAVSEGEKISYGELDKRANQWAHYLIKRRSDGGDACWCVSGAWNGLACGLCRSNENGSGAGGSGGGRGGETGAADAGDIASGDGDDDAAACREIFSGSGAGAGYRGVAY